MTLSRRKPIIGLVALLTGIALVVRLVMNHDQVILVDDIPKLTISGISIGMNVRDVLQLGVPVSDRLETDLTPELHTKPSHEYQYRILEFQSGLKVGVYNDLVASIVGTTLNRDGQLLLTVGQARSSAEKILSRLGPTKEESNQLSIGPSIACPLEFPEKSIIAMAWKNGHQHLDRVITVYGQERIERLALNLSRINR